MASNEMACALSEGWRSALLMAFQILSSLRAIAPVIAEAGRLAAGLRSGASAKTDDRLLQLEQEAVRAGNVIRGLAEQLQAVAQELQVQAAAAEALQRKATTLLYVSIGALGVGIAALVVSLVHV
jgi:hypothetical protein